jgi:hypothetical protein
MTQLAGETTAEFAARIAEAVLGCPGVTDLSAGPLGRVVSYRPGEPLKGVTVGDDEIEVSVVVAASQPVTRTAAAVRDAVLPLAGERAVHVIVADLAT